MMSKHCFESLDRTMSDIIGNKGKKPFSGKVVVFGGDFRQVSNKWCLKTRNSYGGAKFLLSLE